MNKARPSSTKNRPKTGTSPKPSGATTVVGRTATGASRPRRGGLRKTETVTNENRTAVLSLRRAHTLNNKTSRGPRIRRSPRRVVSHGAILTEPKHHTMVPRRSSFKKYASKPSLQVNQAGETPPRRVSFGNSAISEVSKAPKEAKENIWYNKRELGKLRRKVRRLIEKGPSDLDESEDSWRGLEVFAKQEEDRKADIVPDLEKYKLILLVLQQERCDDLLLLQQRYLVRFTEEGTQAAAQDAAEAQAIYKESMDAEIVQAFFQSASTPPPPTSAANSGGSPAISDHARVA